MLYADSMLLPAVSSLEVMKMTEDTIKVPIRVEGKEFYADRIDKALRACQSEGYEALFMPAIIDTRIEAPKEAIIWQYLYCAPSIKATGRTKQGTPVVVYAHIPNYFSNPDNIEKAIEQGLVNGAGIMPRDEFQRLLDLEDNENVFAVDYSSLWNSPLNVIPVKNALKHPQTIPFLGGEERAERYLQRHREVFGDEIGIWHSDDLLDKPSYESLCRLLFVGNGYDDGLDCVGGLSSYGRFVGVRAEGALQKIKF